MNSRMNSSETELVQAAQGGDTLAFEELIRRYERRLLQVAHGIMGNMQDAYDAYQDGIIRAYTKLDSFRFESSFGTWLTRIVINQSLNLKKKLRWSSRLSLDTLMSDKMEFEEISHAEQPDELMVRTELSATIQMSLDNLSDRERTVFVLKHQHGYKLREIAVMLECAEGTIKNYMFRATQKMRKALGAHAPVTSASTLGSD
ncbi:MAG: sigma-70 family RNA polymerase sigma factor [Bacteroidetes bacterium]|nr:sigma-70 family RNA polymerase sigma factor [Bacteroidota bacterium]MCH8246857.1 sigma-70 family RNA polymerase sigma factor [Bacteroidota bacterium]